MKRDPFVERWMHGKPAEPILRRVRDVILWSDSGMSEYLKYGTVQFACQGDLASFVQHDKRTVTLMFNRAAKIPGRYPHLEGSGPSARFMRFGDVDEVIEREEELTRIVKAWCEMMAPKPKARASGAKKRTAG